MQGMGRLDGTPTQNLAENKLFVGGAPPGCDEATLQAIFAEHGEVEEVFVMRGGSRSGQACAFVRFTTAEGAVAAIQAIHGKYIMPGCTDPLVVRYADAPGSRAKKGGGAGGGRGFQGGYNGSPSGYQNGGQYGMGYGGQYGNGGQFGMGPGMGGGMQMPMGGMGGGAMGGMGGMNAGGGGGMMPGDGSSNPQNGGQPGGQMPRSASGDVKATGGASPDGARPNPGAVISGKPVEGVADWAGYTAPDGRTYYYNAKTGVSSWEKPTPASA